LFLFNDITQKSFFYFFTLSVSGHLSNGMQLYIKGESDF